jgi:hypothetical protein
MGSDDLFHKRKAKAADDLRRRKAKRAPYAKVLIVCEGEKTEPLYFEDLVAENCLNSANVEVDRSSGSSPKSVFEHAVNLWEKEQRKGDPFDKVYCVFDKDSHESYQETLKRIAIQKPEGIFFAAVSVPCFEYWLLLHFEYTTKPYSTTGGSSCAEEAIKDLHKYMPNYSKGDTEIYSTLKDQLDFAKANAKRSLQHAASSHTDNPSTNICELVELLEQLKE